MGRGHEKRARLFKRQRGLCHWCKKPMRLMKPPPKMTAPILDLCTLDHLDDRYNQERGNHFREYRVVAACWGCNRDRNEERQRTLPRETLWAASRAYPAEIVPPYCGRLKEAR